MKRMVFLVVSLLCLVGSVYAGGMTVTTASVKVIPRRSITSATVWTNGIAIAQGQIVQNGGWYYMAEVAIGSSTDAPVHTVGVANNLRVFSPRERRAVILHNCSDTVDLWINLDTAAAVNQGFRLIPKATASFEGYQNAVYAITAAGSAVLSYVDVDK